MPYTTDDLILEVAQRLGVAPDGQAAEPESVAKIRRVLPSVVGDLAGRGVYVFDDLDAIPDETFLHLAGAVSGSLTNAFGLASDASAEMTARALAAEQALRKLTAMPYSGARARPQFF